MSGDNHYVEFDGVQATNYRLMRRSGSGPVEVQGWEPMSSDVTMTVSSTEMEFNFEGQALGAYNINLVGESRSFRVDVIPITGATQVTETT